MSCGVADPAEVCLVPSRSARSLPFLLLVVLAEPVVAASPAIVPAPGLTGKAVLDGKPVAGAVVEAVPFEEPLEQARREARGGAEPKALLATTTAGDGTFTLSHPAGAGEEALFRVRVRAKGAATVELHGIFVASETLAFGELPLRKAQLLVGRVSSAEGSPVSGARVTLRARGGFDASSVLTPVPEETTTGADGTFRFEGAAAERNALEVDAPGFARTRLEGLRAGVQRLIVLRSGTSVAGQVRRRDGSPAARALVRFESGAVDSRWAEAGADGTFTLRGLPAGRGVVVADSGDDGYAEAPLAASDAERPPLSLRLAPPSVLEGRTLDLATLRPIPRVRLTLSSSQGRVLARSGADGRYRVRGLRPGRVSVRADEPRHVIWEREGPALEKGATKTLDIPLVRGASLSGRVVDEERRPVAGAELYVGSDDGSAFRRAIGRLAGAPGAGIVSRADGTFSASRVPPNEALRVVASHPDYEQTRIGGLSLSPGGGRSDLVVTLRRGAVLSGSVRDAEGSPVAGAELTLDESVEVGSSRRSSASRSFGGYNDLPSARSRADGGYDLKGVPEGDWALTVRAVGKAVETVDPITVVRGTRPDPVDVVLVPGATISGSIVRKTGGGVEGYLVFARPSGRPPVGGRGTGMPRSGPDGTFLLEGLKEGERYDLQLWGSSVPGPGPTKRGISAPSAGVDFVVEGTGRVEGVAVDAKTGAPLREFEVSWQPDSSGYRTVMRGTRRLAGLRGGAGEVIAVEDAEGRFALEDVVAGKCAVVVTAKGYPPAMAGGIVVEEATTTEGVEVRLAPGSTLKGRVTDAKSGKPVPEATVSVFPEAGLSGSQAELITDLEGRFESEVLATGKVRVRVEHEDYEAASTSAELKEGGGAVEVPLSRGSSLAGVVLSESRQPVQGAEVSLRGANAQGRGYGGDGALADSSGRFRFDHLAPGRYTLRASGAGRASNAVEAVVVADASKEDVVLVLSGGAAVRGTVKGLTEPLRGRVSVEASGPDGYWETRRAGADGRFELSGVPAGTIRVRASAGDLLGGSSLAATGVVTIAEGQTDAEVEVVFEGASTLTGKVTRGGRPAVYALVSVFEKKSLSGGSGRTDDSGSYRIEGLVAGTYAVSVQASGGRRGWTGEVEVRGEAVQDVELPTASLTGLVVDAATGRALSDVRITASLDDSPAARPGAATTDSNGRFLLDELDAGCFTLTLRRTGYQEGRHAASASEAGGDAGTIELARGEGLELRVVDGVFQIPLRSVNVSARDGGGAIVASAWISLDADGRGELAALKTGRYTLVVGSEGYAVRVLGGVAVPGPSLPVSLTPGGSVEIRPGETSRAKGVATLRDPLGQSYPHRVAEKDGRVAIPPVGPATISNLAPGSYTLAVEGVAPKGFTVTEGGKTVVELP